MLDSYCATMKGFLHPRQWFNVSSKTNIPLKLELSVNKTVLTMSVKVDFCHVASIVRVCILEELSFQIYLVKPVFLSITHDPSTGSISYVVIPQRHVLSRTHKTSQRAEMLAVLLIVGGFIPLLHADGKTR